MVEKSRKRWGMRRMLGSFAVAFALAGSIGALAAQARTLNVDRPSEEQIRKAVAEVDLSKQIAYAKTPVTSGNYDPGELTSDTQNDAVKTLNVVRYIAGIPDNVGLDTTYMKYAQAGALVNYVNDKMEHKPPQPSDMDTELYKTGYKGTSEGNLHSSTATTMSMNSAIVTGWMADNGDNNLDTVGHRRWCLNPTMQKTGFGAVTGSKGSYACMYAFDGSRTTSSYDTVVWPAQTMPTEYFGDSFPWSISSNTSFSENTLITLTRNRKGQETTWNFSPSSSEGYFTVNNDNYGMPGCVIFRPSNVGSYQDGDVFTVTVKEGGSTTLSYTVNFFSLVKAPETAKISLWSNVMGVPVNDDGKSNQIIITDKSVVDKSVTTDKIGIEIENPDIVSARTLSNGSNLFLYVNGLQEGKSKVTVSLANGSSASCVVTVYGTGHTHVYKSMVIKEPTCYENGLTASAVCECGATAKDCTYSVKPKLEHTFVTVEGKKSTCLEDGLTDGISCSECGYVKQEQTVIKAPGHHTEEVDIPAKEPTCTEPGCTEGTKCSVCGEVLKESVTIPEKGHTEENVPEIEPTCEEPGTSAWVRCSVCDAVIVGPEEIPALGHDKVIDKAASATCTEPGWTEGWHCSRCDAKEEPEEVAALGHDFEYDESTAKSATCTEPGLTALGKCSRCGEIDEQKTIKPLGHEIVIDEEVPATCTEDGLTEGEHCTKCDYIVEQETISALGHNIVIDKAVEATCTESGLTAGEHCTRCDYAIEQETIPALGHDPVIDEAVEATCTERGLTEGKHCDRCGTVLTRQRQTAALGHDYKVIDPAIAPTCTEDGKSAERECRRCGVVEESQTIEALGHEEQIIPAVDPTCMEWGKTEGSVCSRCNEVLVAQSWISPLGHNWVEAEAVAPTYEMDGRTAGVYCTRCEEIYEGMEVIPKLVRPVPQSPAVGVTVNDMKSGGTYTVSVAGPAGTAAVTFKAPANKNAASVTVPDVVVLNNVACKVTAIAPNAFKNNKKLKNVKIGANIVTIGANAFSGCKKLANVTFSAGVTTIETKAFFKCTGLKKVTIPASVTKIGKQAFNGCAKLKTIVIKSTKLTARNVGAKAFAKIGKNAKVKVPKKCLKTYKKLLRKKGLPASVKVKK